MFGEVDVLLTQSGHYLNLQYLLLQGIQQALQVEPSSLLRFDHVYLLLLLEVFSTLTVFQLQQHHHHIYCVLEVNRHMLLLLVAIVKQGPQIFLILDVEQREVLLNQTQEERYVEFVEEGFVEFWVIAF